MHNGFGLSIFTGWLEGYDYLVHETDSHFFFCKSF